MSDGPFYIHDNIDGSFIVRTKAGTLRAADWFWDRAEAERWCNSYNACIKMGAANLAAENETTRTVLKELMDAFRIFHVVGESPEAERARDAMAAAKKHLLNGGGAT